MLIALRRTYEFEVQLPIQSLLRIQLWDWDMASTNDLIAETKIDVENRWFSSHRATCGLPKRYDRFFSLSQLIFDLHDLFSVRVIMLGVIRKNQQQS